MHKFIVFFILICSIFASQQVFNKRRTEKAFKSLVKGQVGKDIFSSISLELQTLQNVNVVTTIMKMLKELQENFTDSQEDTAKQLAQKGEYCGEKIASLETDIEELTEKIGKSSQSLPILQEAADLKDLQVVEKQKEIDSSNEAIAAVHEKNTTGKKNFADSVQEHDDMVAALEKAKGLISQLIASGFLQKRSTIVSQLKQHQKNSLSLLQTHQHKGIFKVILNLAQSLDGQDEQVSEIIAIIDELINHEKETASVEFQAEQKRIERSNYDLTRASTAAQQLQASILDLQADAKSLNLRATELAQDIQQWKTSLANKTEQLGLQTKTCQDTEASLKATQQSNSDLLSVIEELIAIFESADIQDIKVAVKEVSYGL